jgi:hypothetical protein
LFTGYFFSRVDYTLSGTAGQVVFSPGRTSATVTLTALKESKHAREKKDMDSATITIQSGISYLIGPNKITTVAIQED